MNPTFEDGEEIIFEKINLNHKIEIDDIIVFNHPFNSGIKVVKRISKIKDKVKLFVEGDNPDYLSSDDSHNFGLIDSSKIIAIKKEKK